MKMSQFKFIALSGISGAGKTTLAKILAQNYNAIHFDEDDFYIEIKPKVTLSNGLSKSNWDTFDALKIKLLNQEIKKCLQKNSVFLSGFALPDHIFDPDIKPDLHIHLRIPKSESLKTRLAIKDFRDKSEVNNTLYFNECIVPFYEENLKNSTIHHFIDVFDNDGNRKSLDKEIEEIEKVIKKLF